MGSCLTKSGLAYLSNDECLPLDLDLDPKKLPTFVPPLATGRVIKVYDGDTITVAARLPGLQGSPVYKWSVRLSGIDTPELRSKDPEEKQVATQARDALSEKIFGQDVRLGNVELEKYGRLLCDVYAPGGEHVNKWMVDERWAVTYDGGKKMSPSSWKNYHENRSADVGNSLTE